MANKTSSVIITNIDSVPVTKDRKPWNHPEGDKRLKRPGTARAYLASSYDQPQGTTSGGWAAAHRDKTVLQQHVEFFDRGGKGIIYVSDTIVGFWKLGFSIFSVHAALLVHLAFSYATAPGILPDPLFRIYTANIHRGKHGGDSSTYDNEGRFVPQEFENMFAKYADSRDTMTLEDVWRLNRGQRLHADPFGAIMSIFWWHITYYMLWPEDRQMKKEDIRGIYDGSIFYTISERRIAQAENAKQSKSEAQVNGKPFKNGKKEQREQREPREQREQREQKEQKEQKEL